MKHNSLFARTLRPLAVVFALCGARVAPAEAHLDREALAVVREAALWLSERAEPVPGGTGVRFPEYAEVPEEHPTSLYAGSAGVLVFLENAAALLDDAKLRELADRTAAGLLGSAARDEGGHPTWPSAGAHPTAEPTPNAGLYTGDAGVGCAFLIRARLRGNPEALEVARAIAAGIMERAHRDGELYSWDTSYDIIAGAAGTTLFLLELGLETGDARMLAAARGAGRWLARVGKDEEGVAKDASARQLWWEASAGNPRNYPNFSHGTAGVAYALARVALATGDTECKLAAEAGGRWLLAHAHADENGLCWGHYLPDKAGEFREGWCHGPSGTARTFFALAALTGDKDNLQAAARSTDWLIATKLPDGVAADKLSFYSPSFCCGAAGVIDIFVDAFRATGEARYRTAASRTAEYLLGRSKADGSGRKWTNYDRPDEKGITYHGVSLMLGAAGEALAFLRLAALGQAQDPVATLPDRRVLFDPPAPPPAEITEPAEPSKPAPPPVTPPAQPPASTGLSAVATTPAEGHSGTGYVVLVIDEETKSPLAKAARELEKWRKGTVVTGFDPANPEAVLPRLKELGARNVAIVLAPDQIDANTQRRFLMAAARLDEDIFVDLDYGFVTGTARTSPLEMVKRARRIEAEGLRRRWATASVATSIKSMIYPKKAGDPTAERAGWEGVQIYWGARESDPDVLDFVGKHLSDLSGGGVVQFSGCGDPEGIWLFSDQRNLRKEEHWKFDPKKVGYDPKGEMPRITAAQLGRVDLSGSVVWSGVCHTGSLERVYVEGDIVSTFGTTDGYTEYQIPAGRSLAAVILDDGAAAMILPVGPNHGYRNLVESQAAFEGNLSLGGTMRSTYNDIALAQGQAPQLDLYLPEVEHVDRGPGAAMFGGGANRLLYGDPALAPFKDKVEPAITVKRSILSGDVDGFELEATRTLKDWWAWDMFARDRNGDRLHVIVPLLESDKQTLQVTVKAFGAKGEPIAAARLDAQIELDPDGKRLLHLQVAAPRESGLGETGARAVFTIL